MQPNQHTISRGILAMLGTVFLAAIVGMGQGPQSANEPAVRAMQRLKEYVGDHDFKGKIDMSAIGQPGVEVGFTGTSTSQFVLDGTGMLFASEADSEQSLSYMGYRTDSNEYYNINLDQNQTALGYMAGKFIKPDVMKLTEPMSGTTAEWVLGSDGASTTTVRIPPNQAVFMQIRNTRTGNAKGDVLKRLMSSSVKPARVNRKSDSPNPAENYSRAHELLQKLAGNFTTSDGFRISSRMVGEGRYLLTHVTEPMEMLIFTAYNNAGRFFQQMTVGPTLPMPMYLQGPVQADGSIMLADPFNPNGIKAVVRFGPNGEYRTSTSLGGKVVEERTWEPQGTSTGNRVNQ